MWISTANARAIGYVIGPVPQDSTVYFNPVICNFNRININPNKYVYIHSDIVILRYSNVVYYAIYYYLNSYDLLTVILHEIDEVLGKGSGLGKTIGVNPPSQSKQSTLL